MKKNIASLIRCYYQKKWLYATSGNFSYKKNNQLMYVTASGINKKKISFKNFILVDINTNIPYYKFEKRKISDEALLHCTIYQLFSNAKIILHTHSLLATFLSKMLIQNKKIIFSNYEILKALPNIKTHNCTFEVPIIENSQDMNILSKEIKILAQNNDQLGCFLISGHGLYIWGNSLFNVNKYIEAIEFLFELYYNELKIKNKEYV